jgi:hypothetical protein
VPFEKYYLTRSQWLIAVILATKEIEIKSIIVQIQSQKITPIPYLKYFQLKKDWQTG